jgi:hypothetical protein
MWCSPAADTQCLISHHLCCFWRPVPNVPQYSAAKYCPHMPDKVL